MPMRRLSLGATVVSAVVSAVVAAAASWLPMAPAAAQVQQFLLGPGSSVGPETKVKPKNCVTGSDGSITCDTQLESPASDTQAKPLYNPFNN
jgi:hypothetical protein